MNKRDIILISTVLFISLVFIFTRKLNQNDNNYAYVYYENEIIKKINLKKDYIYEVNGYKGKVVIEVNNEKIRVKEETSKNHICSKQGYVTNTPIICLPNKIVIEFEDNNELDGIVG